MGVCPLIVINIDKAKAIAHDYRRAARVEEFAPFDQIIAAQIPGADFAAAEANRQAIREKYAAIQAGIDAASDVDGLKTALEAI